MNTPLCGIPATGASIGYDVLADRWNRVRLLARAEALGPLIVYGSGVLGQYGLVHYLTGTFPDPKGTYVVFGNQTPPVIVARSPQERLRLQRYGNSPVEIAYPSSGSRHARLQRVAELVAAQRDHNPPAVAAGGLHGLPWSDHQRLMTLLDVPGFADASRILNLAKRPKTPTDLIGMECSIRLAEEALDLFLADGRVGMTEREAAAVIESHLRACGALTSLVDVSAGPYLSQAPTGRVIASGDLVTVFIETAGADGYWVELGVLVAFGTVAGSLWTLAEQTIETTRRAELLATPGCIVSDLAHSIDQLVERFGRPAFGYGHGVGIDEEQPTVSRDDDSILETGMTLALHPSILTETGDRSLAVANTYFIDSRRAVPLSERPYGVYRIP